MREAAVAVIDRRLRTAQAQTMRALSPLNWTQIAAIIEDLTSRRS